MVPFATEQPDLLADNAFNAPHERGGGVVDEGYFHRRFFLDARQRCTRVSRLATLAAVAAMCAPSFIRQGSSEVEQGTHKPLVGSSILPPGTISACSPHRRRSVRPKRLQKTALRSLGSGRALPGSVDPEHSRAAAGFSSLQSRFVWNSLRLSGGVLL